MLFHFSIGPKIGTSVAPPTYKASDHGLNKVKMIYTDVFKYRDMNVDSENLKS